MKDRDPKSIAGAIFFATCAILLLGGAYAMWPPDVFAGPLSDLTLAVALRAAASLALAFIGLEFLGALAVLLLADT